MLDAKDMATNVENHAKIHQNEAERLLKLQETHKKITEKGRLRKERSRESPGAVAKQIQLTAKCFLSLA